ncbi:MAG: hypothetical protein ACKO4N_08580 [Verrucomicrobiota bacterium]
MPEQDEDIELALAALRPRPPSDATVRAVAESLDAPRQERSNVIVWFSGLAAAACLALAFLVLPEAEPVAEAAAFGAAESRSGLMASAPALDVTAAPAAGAGRGFGGGAAKSAAPYRLVSAQVSPSSIEMLEPVRLRDGTYVRPVRMRREHSTHWETPGSGSRLVRSRPEERTILLPLETY